MARVSEFRRSAGLLLLLCFSTWTNALVKTNGSEAAQQAAASSGSQASSSSSALRGGSLVVGLSRASESYAEIAWRLELPPLPHSKHGAKDEEEEDHDLASRLSACELAYGPIEDPYQVEVMSNFMPRGPTFVVGGLKQNTTYHFHMVCYCCLPPPAAASPSSSSSDSGGNNGTAGTESKLTSNVLKFTTGVNVGDHHSATYQRPWSTQQQQDQSSDSRSSSGSEWRQRDPYQGSYHSVYKQTILRDEDSSSRAVPSFNVLLGALTGIVGFLIINVTVVIAVRRCSHRRMRRRRILVLEDRDNEDFPYLRPLD